MNDSGDVNRRVYLRHVVDGAYLLLQYAVENGVDVPADVRAAIPNAKISLDDGADISADAEASFLGAYAVLVHAVQPVTSQSLKDTDDAFGRRGKFLRFISLPQWSEAKLFSSKFATLAIVFLLLIAVGEFGLSFVRETMDRQQDAFRLIEQKRDLGVKQRAIERQLTAQRAAASADSTAAGAPSAALLKENLEQQKQELQAQADKLDAQLTNANEATRQGFTAIRSLPLLGVVFRQVGGEYLIAPAALSLAGFILPLLYGAVGACAFILRSVIVELHSRSFDKSQVGDYGTRIYLGMLSGVAIQWVFTGNGKQIPGGFTPAVLAFAGGYSVEMIFTVFDRIIKVVTDAVSGSASGVPAVAAPPNTPVLPPGPPQPRSSNG